LLLRSGSRAGKRPDRPRTRTIMHRPRSDAADGPVNDADLIAALRRHRRREIGEHRFWGIFAQAHSDAAIPLVAYDPDALHVSGQQRLVFQHVGLSIWRWNHKAPLCRYVTKSTSMALTTPSVSPMDRPAFLPQCRRRQEASASRFVSMDYGHLTRTRRPRPGPPHKWRHPPCSDGIANVIGRQKRPCERRLKTGRTRASWVGFSTREGDRDRRAGW
jgi:hypothetical protein